MDSSNLKSDFTELVRDTGADQHPAWPAFLKAMENRAYGYEAQEAAWGWFKQGHSVFADEVEKLRALRCNCDEESGIHHPDCAVNLSQVVDDMRTEIDHLRALLATTRQLLREARDNAIASTAEIDISDARRVYRQELAKRLSDTLTALAPERADD